MTTYPQEYRERARTLYRAGVTQKEIAHTFGVSKTTVSRWVNPHREAVDLLRAREYKARQRGRCEVCGASTRYSGKDGQHVSARCKKCADERQRKWTRETVVDAIKRFAAEHGRPPLADEWVNAEKGYPPRSAVYGYDRYKPFWTWNDAIKAAGFTPRISYERTPEFRARMSELARRRRREGVT